MTPVAVVLGQFILGAVLMGALILFWVFIATAVRDYRTWSRGYDARRRRTIERLCDVTPIRQRVK